jgi:hypothetical protein
MTDETDVLSRLVAFHDHIPAPAPPVTDDVRRGRRRLRRNRALRSGSVAVAVAAVVAAATLLAGKTPHAAPQPATRTPTPSPVLVNGQISGAAEHFRGTPTAGDYDWRGYDVGTDRGLFASEPVCGSCSDRPGGLKVVGRAGVLATLSCGTQLTCRGMTGSSDLVGALGPGTDEVTVALKDRTMRVVAYDGTVRRTIDLRTSLAPGEGIRKLVWSHDGRALAVLTNQTTGGAGVERVRLVDENGDGPVAYAMMSRQDGPDRPPLTLRPADFDAVGDIWDLGGWSPDDTVLLLDVLVPGRPAAHPSVVAIRTAGPGRPVAKTLYRSDRHFDWAHSVAWSPDGTRVAVRTHDHIVEISPVDGRVLATHPQIDGWLIWLPAQGGRP